MGLLDEAIKQHLELKRRRGADPSEIDRLEREALGPVRRLQQEPDQGTVPAEDADLAYQEQAYAGEPYDEHNIEPEGGYEPAEEALEFPSEGGGSRPDAQIVPESDPLGSHGVVSPEEAPLLDDLIEPEELPPEPGDDPGVATVEYDVESEHALEETDGEDVLEETPEFFQDAPDHDRLWFEQRPPKDFDFEG